MKLRFYAKPGHVCHWPAAMRVTGQVYPYVGRDLVPGNPASGIAVSHPAKKEPVEIDDEHPDQDTRVRAERLKELTRRDGALWPADEATAAACGVDFVAVEMRDGEWQPKAAPPSKTTKPKE